MGCSKRDISPPKTCRRGCACVCSMAWQDGVSAVPLFCGSSACSWFCAISAGDSHDVAALGDILGDRMLQAWKQRGEKLQKDDM